MNWDFLVSALCLHDFPLEWNLENFFLTIFFADIRIFSNIPYYTCSRLPEHTFFPYPLWIQATSIRGDWLQRETAEQGIRRDRISVVGVLHVTRQMRRWRVPVRNSSLAHCPPAEMPAVWKSRGNIPSNSAATRRKLVNVKCGKCESTDKVSYHFAIQIMHDFRQLRC